MDSMNECVIEWIKGKNTASVTCPSNSRLAGKIRKLAEKSLSVDILSDKNGALFAHVPVNFVSIRPARELSEERRQAAAESLQKAREARS